MTNYKGIALLAAAASCVTVCEAFAMVPVQHSRWVGQNRLTDSSKLPTTEEARERRDLLSSAFDSMRMQVFLKALHDVRHTIAVDSTVAASSHLRRSKSSRTCSANHIKSLSHEILWHAFLATLLARFCFPRLPLSPLLITVAMSIVKRKDFYAVRSHEW